jgi:hypothetical protein
VWQELRVHFEEKAVGLVGIESDLDCIERVHSDEVQKILYCLNFLYGLVFLVVTEKHDMRQVRGIHREATSGDKVSKASNALDITRSAMFRSVIYPTGANHGADRG